MLRRVRNLLKRTTTSGMSTRQATAVLLPLTEPELQVVADALVAFAYAEEETGDPLGVVAHADRIRSRIRNHEDMLNVQADQMLRIMGLGRYANRPQG